jgi:hypothetical protein
VTSRQLRLVRAAAVSSVATLIAAVSHTLGGGAGPHPLLILAVATLLTPLCALLVGARTSRPRVGLAVLLSQAVFHLLFQALGSPTGSAISRSAGHSHHLDLALLGPTASVAVADASMLFAHVVAAALTTLLVWHGESVLRTVARWVQALLLRAALGAPTEHHRPAPLRSVLLSPLDATVSPGVSRRGPPALSRG